MIRVLRILGFLLIVVGTLLAASWFIEPLRQIWPMLVELPLPIRLGLIVSGIGLLVVFATIVHDRLTSDPASIREDLGGEE